MGRLIDADALMEAIEKWLAENDNDEVVKNLAVSVLMTIEEQPTAYDPEQVLWQVTKRSVQARPVGWSNSFELAMLADVIEAVQSGGVEHSICSSADLLQEIVEANKKLKEECNSLRKKVEELEANKRWAMFPEAMGK